MNYKEFLAKAQHYCAYQERCHKEVRNKLREWKVPVPDRESIIVDLIEGKYLNEERFARAFAGGKFRVKRWGRNKIIRELKFRDISDYCIKKAMEEIPDQDYETVMRELIHKKNATLKDRNIFSRKAKVAKYVIGKGYESGKVWDYLRSAEFDNYRE